MTDEETLALAARMRGHANFHYATAEESRDFNLAANHLTTLLAERDAALVEGARLREALQDVANPLGKLKRDAEAQGAQLSSMAYSIAHDLYFVKSIAKDALFSIKDQADAT